MAGCTLMVSRAENLFPQIKRRLEALGFQNVVVTAEEKDSLNFVVNDLKPSLVLMMSGFYRIATPYMAGELLRVFPDLNIAVVSLSHCAGDQSAWFVWYGARSYISLYEGSAEFYGGMERVRSGGAYIAPSTQRVIDGFSEWPDTRRKATRRHREILLMLCAGFLPERIGGELHITKRTVTTHLQDMYRIFHVKNREEMVALAWELELVTRNDVLAFDRGDAKKIEMPEWGKIKLAVNAMNNEQGTINK